MGERGRTTLYPQQPPDLGSGSVPAGMAANFVRQACPQKKYVCPSRSAWMAVSVFTAMPQIGSLAVVAEVFIMSCFLKVV